MRFCVLAPFLLSTIQVLAHVTRRRGRPKVRCGLVGLLLLVAALLPATAFACAPGVTSLLAGSSHVATDGALMLLFQCSYDCEPTPPELTVLDSSEGKVVGKIEILKNLGRRQWVAWRPAQPFAADATYTAQGSYGKAWQFDTKSAPPEPKLSLTFQATLTSVGVGEQVCCERYPYRMYCHGEGSCFQKQRQEAVSLALQTVSAPTAFDFLYRITFRSGSDVKVLPDQPDPAAVFISETAADDYCYEVDAIRLTTSEVIRVAEGCQSLGLRSFVVRPPTDAELKTNLDICKEAPPGYEADWKRLGFFGRPGDVQTQSPGATADAAADAVDDEQSNSVDEGPRATQPNTNGGCSVTRGARAPHSVFILLLALSLTRYTRRGRSYARQ